jgi:choline dehydrogenase-like flavoprotein
MSQVSVPQEPFNAVVVGSGATGGWAAERLTDAERLPAWFIDSNQAHEVKNMFVTDGACWVSSGCQNPTLTRMAITVRACDYITREFPKQMA